MRRGIIASARVASGPLAADAFNRADNPSSLGVADVGGTWLTTGTWGVLSNRARCYSNDTIATLDVGRTAGYRVRLAMTGPQWPGLVFRYVDVDNFYLMEWSNGEFNLMRRMAGSTAVLAAYSRDVWGGAFVEVVESSGTEITSWTTTDETPMTFTDTTSGRPAGTRVGMRGQDRPTGEFDDFAVEAL